MVVFVPSSGGPLHVQVAQRLRDLIARKYPVGQVLPNYDQLARQFRVGRLTLKKAMDGLAAAGIVTPVRRRGTIVARQLEAGERRLEQVGLIVGCTLERIFISRYLADMFAGLFGRFRQFRWDARIFSGGQVGQMVSPAEVGRSGVDALIVVGAFDDRYAAPLASIGLPMVVVDNHNHLGLDYVVCDNFAAAARVVEHLLGLGHRRLAYVHWPGRVLSANLEHSRQEESDCRERRQGFFQAARAAGLGRPAELRLRQAQLADDPLAQARLLALLSCEKAPRHDAPTALVVETAALAVEIIDRLAQAGIRAPRDLSLAAIAGASDMELRMPGLTRCQFNFYEMGQRAGDLLELRGRTPRPEQPNIVRIGFQFIRGKTAGKPSRA